MGNFTVTGAVPAVLDIMAQQPPWQDDFNDMTRVSSTDNVTVDRDVFLNNTQDMTDWIKHGMVVNNGGTYDTTHAYQPSVIFHDGEYKMWYTGYEGSNARILYANSSDGFTWAKQGLAIDIGGVYDSIGAGGPCVIFDNLEYRMWYSGSDGTNSRILYANSSDGIIWTKHGLVLDIGGAGEDSKIFNPTVIKDSDGTYKMWYNGLGSTYQTYLATSPDGLAWTKQGLVMGYGQLYEEQGNYAPTAVKMGDTYYMWYSGKATSGRVRILHATSQDGITWTKKGLAINYGQVAYEDESVDHPAVLLDNGTLRLWYTGYLWVPSNTGRILYATLALPFNPMSWEKHGVAMPLSSSPAQDYWINIGEKVLKENGTYKMWYAGQDGTNYRLFYANSIDGLTWTHQGRILDLGTPGGTEDWGLGNPMVINDGGTYKMWYGGYDGSIWRIHYATSPDGLAWTRQGLVLDLGSGGELDDAQVTAPMVLKESANYYRMWYGGSDGANWRIFHAHSSDGVNWIKDGAVITSTSSSTPYVVKINGIYCMWYANANILYATSPDGFTWTQRGTALSKGASGTDSAAVNNPSILVDNTDVKMWYSGSVGGQYRIHLATTPLFKETWGQLVSETITLPGGHVWTSLNLTKTEPGVGNTITVSVMDDVTGLPVPGFTDMAGTDINISSIDGGIYPSIRLQANFTGNGTATPVLHDWHVNWTWITNSGDDVPPEIIDITSDQPTTGSNMNLNALVSDNIAVAGAFVEYQIDTGTGMGSVNNVSMDDMGGGNYRFVLAVPIDAVGLQYRILAEDSAGNWNRTAFRSLAVNDIILPEVFTMSASPSTGDVLMVYAEALDNIGVRDVFMEYFFNTTQGTQAVWNSTMSSSGGNYSISMIVPDDALEFCYFITLVDSAGNWNNSTTHYLPVLDNDSPAANAPQYIAVDEDTEMQFNASDSTDNIGVSNCSWLFDYDGMVVGLYGQQAAFTFNIPGNYSVLLSVLDAAGNSDDMIFSVAVADITAPTAHAGPDAEIYLGDSLNLDGRDSVDNVGVSNFTWTFDYNGTRVVLYGPNPDFRFWSSDIYVVELNVTDLAGNSNVDSMRIVVLQQQTGGIMDYWWIIIILVAAIILSIILFLARRRKKQASTGQAYPPPPPKMSNPPASGYAYPPPPPVSTQPDKPPMDKNEEPSGPVDENAKKLALLEERYQEGAISRETYEMLKSKYTN